MGTRLQIILARSELNSGNIRVSAHRGNIEMSPEDRATFSQEAERLKRYYEGASELVKVDFRRRYDRAWAVICRCRAVWERLDQVQKELAQTRGNKWRPIFSGLLIIGGLLYLWLFTEQSLPYTLGTAADTLGTLVAIYAAGYFVFLKWMEHSLKSEMISLEMREADFLCEWQSTGAYSADFRAERDLYREGIDLLLHKPTLSESERTKRDEEIRLNSELLRHKSRLAIFFSASGTRENRRLRDDGGELEFYLQSNE
jgi:hypothetical protein